MARPSSKRNNTSRSVRGATRQGGPGFFRRLVNCTTSVWHSYIEGDCQLKPPQIARLSEHVYSSVDTSWLDEICMKRFWNFVVEFCPLWLAPNLLTLTGLLINLVTVLVLAKYCFSATETAPFWAYLLAALGLFLYQTLDAIDGKQARRTNSASPLGELFDHGCDSMTQVFVTLNVCYAMQLGTEHNLVITIVMVAIVMFYCAHWSTYCTGQLRFSKFDVTEAQMTVIGLLIVTAILGPGIWNIMVLGLKLKLLVLTICFVCAIWQVSGYLKVILTEGVGRNGSTVAGTSVIYPLFPLLAVCLPFLMIYHKSTSGIFDENITLLCLCFGAVGAKATNRLIIAHMSRSELEIWDWIYISPLAMILNQYYDFHFNEFYLLLFATVYAYVSLIIFCHFICRQFCEYLDIYCFRIKEKSIQEKTNINGPATSTRSAVAMIDKKK